MTWRELDRDDNYEVPLVTYRCSRCRKLCVSTNPFLTPGACSCERAAITNVAQRRGVRR